MFPLFSLILVMAFLVWAINDGPARLRGGSPADAAELARLREEVDRLSAEVMRLADEQAFMLRLVSGERRPEAEPGPSSPDPLFPPQEPA